jgi:hypothetical protein
MRKSSLILALMLSGCGGTSPEVYQLLVDYFTLPDSCYTSMMQPNSVTTTAPPTALSVQVWDGPENTAFLQVESAALTVDMGAAPNVTVGGIFTGKKVDKGWTFTSDTVNKNTVGIGTNNVITSTTHAEITFERATTFKGNAVLSSSSTCAGTQCSGSNPSCSVSGIVVTGTRVAVNYERAP